MVDKKVIFISYSIKDEGQRNLLKRQSLNTNSPFEYFEYIDMSVKESYDSNWKNRVQTLIRKADGVIVLVSENSLTSDRQKWELACATAENKKLLGVRAYVSDRTVLSMIITKIWTWSNISNFIEIL